ncbi:TRAP transporter substrate-binding protein [Elioraea rosea]|uniref:TRAP transporter substrate-binding protein n=1 Tax=Elioraea rosea TaxID=2492390 RepID=UPI001183E897|nr:TRAP transporter substrate-binding protein [Elioraea rosea]
MSLRRRTALATLAAAPVALAAPAVFAQAQRIRIAGNFATEHSSSVAIEGFKAEVARLSGGRMEVDTFPAMQLGGAQENVSQVRAGTLLMTWVGMAFLSRTVPELEAISLPFQFPTREAAFKVVDGPVGDLLDGRMADKGFISLGYMELGFRHVTTGQKPIRTVEDLRGLKIRMQPNETHLATFRAIGANPVAMDIRELYSALQQRVVDGQENPYAIILASRYFEVQKHLTNTGHFFDFISIVANRRAFGALPAEQQQIIRTAMGTAIKAQREAAEKTDGEALATLQARGMQYDPLPAAELAKMRALSAGVVDTIKGRVGAELVDRVQAEVAKAGA